MSFLQSAVSDAFNSALFELMMPGLASTTRSHGESKGWVRKNSRTTRLIPFLRTASLTCFLAITIPSLDCSPPGMVSTRKCPFPAFRAHRSNTALKSRVVLSLAVAGKVSRGLTLQSWPLASSEPCQLAGEALSTPSTAAGDKLSATLRRHARTEAMGSLAFQNTGLECALHGLQPDRYKLGGEVYVYEHCMATHEDKFVSNMLAGEKILLCFFG